MTSRRAFLGTVAVGAAAMVLPIPNKPEVLDGINPDWDGVFKRYAFQSGEIGPDVMLCSRSMYQYLHARMEMEYDPNTKWVNHTFAKPTNGPWRRIAGGLRYPEKTINIPA